MFLISTQGSLGLARGTVPGGSAICPVAPDIIATANNNNISAHVFGDLEINNTRPPSTVMGTITKSDVNCLWTRKE